MVKIISNANAVDKPTTTKTEFNGNSNYAFRLRIMACQAGNASAGFILGDPGTASREEGIFMGESLQQQRCKLSPTKITFFRLAALGLRGWVGLK